MSYCVNLFSRERFKTRVVSAGNLRIGGENPIRVQSMTTTDTLDTKASVEQSIRMIQAGCELVRLTAPSIKEAENLRFIHEQLISAGYHVPLVADIHFTPNAAEVAARHVEKVRVNPGNYADKKKFEEIEYTDASYEKELLRIEEKFTPLVLQCKTLGRAMRIGTNHGSLSDRILSRYGDTPEGMVESAMEFIRICQKNDFHDIVISMKASNTIVMVQAYRLLVATMIKNKMNYPLHLGVTEAGDGEDGRIKSAVGIGTLLEDGLGDTIRVSLTEEPEAEIPVAQKLISLYEDSTRGLNNAKPFDLPYSPFSYLRRGSVPVLNIGGNSAPVVFADLSTTQIIKPAHFFGFGYNYSVATDKWGVQDLAADFVYIGQNKVDFELPGMLGAVVDENIWASNYKNQKHFYPLYQGRQTNYEHPQLNFISWDLTNFDFEPINNLSNVVLVIESNSQQFVQACRRFYIELNKQGIKAPVILKLTSTIEDAETSQLAFSAKLGSLFIDGFGDGLWLNSESKIPVQILNSTSFGILQATRTRISKTEYISCPSCGRTLFDLQETTAKIRKETAHLKGLKIGIMGCIVNGPGEMADADYGYVGTRPGHIHLYKEKVVVRKNVPESEAVQALISLIKENGDWVDPKN